MFPSLQVVVKQRMTRVSLVVVSLVVIVGCLLPSPLMAQGRGTIAGSVKDSSKSVLPGALIEVQGTDIRVASDGQGQFRIRDLAPGEYKLTISYLGFAPFGVSARVPGLGAW